MCENAFFSLCSATSSQCELHFTWHFYQPAWNVTDVRLDLCAPFSASDDKDCGARVAVKCTTKCTLKFGTEARLLVLQLRITPHHFHPLEKTASLACKLAVGGPSKPDIPSQTCFPRHLSEVHTTNGWRVSKKETSALPRLNKCTVNKHELEQIEDAKRERNTLLEPWSVFIFVFVFILYLYLYLYLCLSK